MDVLFILVCIAIIFIIGVVYLLNSIEQTSDINKLANIILKNDPTIRNFTLGQNPNDPNTFLNVVINNSGQMEIKPGPYPVKKDGQYYIIKEHGTIEEYDDGFRITGIDSINFKCPNGYHGYECKLNAICGPDDNADTIKPLTYTQFNALHLYRNDAEIAMVNKRDTTESIHPRLRIQCLGNNGEFQLQACPDNSLLNKNLQCQVYDICQDSIDGHKHNYQINADDTPLQPNEYYICHNRHSEKMTCENGTVFSSIAKACISQSICIGKGDETIRLTERSYVQCKNDIGLKIDCPNGIIEDANGKLVCAIKLCSPKKLFFTDEYIRFVYGEIKCIDDNTAVTKFCNTDKNPKHYTFQWAVKSEFVINNWPTEILYNGECIPPTDHIFIKPIVNLRYTDAMPKEHPYNLKNRRFVCKSNTKYRWDYDQQTSIPHYDNYNNDPNTSKRIVYSGDPCQNNVVLTRKGEYPFKFKITGYPNMNIYIFVVEPVHIEAYEYDDDKKREINHWPIQTDDGLFKHTRCTYEDTYLKISNITTKTLFKGFIYPSSPDIDNRLELIGYPDAPKNLEAQYYFIGSGRLERLYFPEYDLIKADHDKFNYLNDNKLDTTKPESIDFAINMNAFDNSVSIPDNDEWNQNYLTIDHNEKTISYKTHKYDLGFSAFRFSSNGKTGKLKYKDIQFEFNTNDMPTIQF